MPEHLSIPEPQPTAPTPEIHHGCYEASFRLHQDEPDQPDVWELICDNCGEAVVFIRTAESFCGCCVGDVHLHDDETCMHPCCPDEDEEDADA